MEGQQMVRLEMANGDKPRARVTMDPEAKLDRDGLFYATTLSLADLEWLGSRGVCRVDQVPEDLFAVVEGQAKYETRLIRLEMSIESMIEKVTLAGFWDTLAVNLRRPMKRAENEQPGANWRMAALDIREVVETGKAKVSYVGGQNPEMAMLSRAWSGSEKDPVSGATEIRVERPRSRKMVVSIVAWWDTLEPKLRDPNIDQEEAARTQHPIGRYAETRMLKDMPMAMRKERETSAAIVSQVREFVLSGEPLFMTTTPKRVAISDENLAAMLTSMSPSQVAEVLGLPLEEVRRRAGAIKANAKKKPEVQP